MADRQFVHHAMDQRSDAWIHARLGRLTASRASDMLAKSRDGKSWGVSRTNLRMQLVLERLTGKSAEKDFQSGAMRTGTEREPAAVGAYEALTGALVMPCGFLAHTDLMTGASLDGYIGDFDVLLSIKCRQPAAHLDFLRTGKIPGDALAQIHHELWLTGAREHHYFSFNPDFPSALQARLVVVKADPAELAAYELMARTFLSEVDASVRELEKMGGAA